MTKYNIQFEDMEAEALVKLAYQELRDPRDQARLIIRDELQRRGLLDVEKVKTEAVKYVHS